MNQKLVQSLVEVIFSLSDEEREYLEQEISKYSLRQEIAKIEQKIQGFEQKYQMQSEDFFQRFQAGELGDSMDFFEWNAYHEMLANAKVEAS
ncbi:hypothetical protein J0895_05740 [Phormidium pseudopriestleyi FRX01]|uniref:Uncharacterized protein n=1 Tax=Phormidium pseudopriestleyi FRX01 TaxID=1759528 RepID=A0ABS3FQI0_9CYAN|nr:hypothetical protein [Phormidium pseudopriestleyi]MBO0348612.1 hypothetical protein [Phormidium pseudopriestleyi FRX01]